MGDIQISVHGTDIEKKLLFFVFFSFFFFLNTMTMLITTHNHTERVARDETMLGNDSDGGVDDVDDDDDDEDDDRNDRTGLCRVV